MKLLALIAVLLFSSISLYANGDDGDEEENSVPERVCYYENDYIEALRVPKTCPPTNFVYAGELSCKVGKETFLFNPISTGIDKNKKEAFEKLREENPKSWIFNNIAFWKMNGNKINFIEGDHIAVFYVDTPSRFRFILDDHKGVINLELTDPNMPIIEYGKPPKNSRQEWVGGDLGYNYYIKDAIRIWTNDQKNQALLCDIVVGM
jgi:hypothetical protein